MATSGSFKRSSDVALFKELQSILKKSNFTKAIEISNKILAANSNDHDVIKIKCICLIHQGEFDKALAIAGKFQFLSYEKAYCNYRLKNLQQALEDMKLIKASDSTGTLHLEAQINYRLHHYDRCIEIYEQLLSNASKKDDSTDLKANLLASYTAASKGLHGVNRDININGSYEIAYNQACALIQCNLFEKAEQALIKSEELCREILAAEDFSPEEIEAEVAIIKVQLAFVYQSTGRPDEALSIYRENLKTKYGDTSVLAIASNNLASVRKERDIFDSYKRLKAISDDTLEEKLNLTQQEAIWCNRAVLLCLMNKGDECREALRKFNQRFPKNSMSVLILSALLLKEKDIEAIEDMLKYGEQSQSPLNRLVLAHCYVHQGKIRRAAQIVESIESISDSPGTVATLVAMYESINDVDAITGILQKALSKHEQSGLMSENLFQLREGNAFYLLKQGKYQQAASVYEDMLASDQLDGEHRLSALASLVIALSYFDKQAAEQRGAILPPLDEVDNFDAVQLENTAPRTRLRAPKYASAEAKKKERKRTAKNPERIARKRQKRKEAYLEGLKLKSDYNASIGLLRPDPERWIPRKQRSYAKRGRRGRQKFVGAQGSGMGAQKDALKLDAAARAAAKQTDAKEEKKAVVATEKTTAVQRKSKKKKRR